MKIGKNFLKVINKAEEACLNSKHKVDDHLASTFALFLPSESQNQEYAILTPEISKGKMVSSNNNGVQ
jgi:hypothetical protein